MKPKILLIIALLSILTVAGSAPKSVIRLTVINKSGMEIAIQLRAKETECATSKDTLESKFYYLPVTPGDRDAPQVKDFYIDRGYTYGMQLFYIETWDPVYGFSCNPTVPNALVAARNLRLTVLPCDQIPRRLGERSMWKYLPYPIRTFKRIWMTRLIY